VYEPFHYAGAHGESQSQHTPHQPISTLRFLKTTVIPSSLTEDLSSSSVGQEPSSLERQERGAPLSPRMRSLANVAGYSAVFIPGERPGFLLKSAVSSPKLVTLRGKIIKGISTIHTESCQRGWVDVDLDVSIAERHDIATYPLMPSPSAIHRVAIREYI
jgi:hypothetical protein